MELFNRFKQIRAFIFALDGVCVDGGVWVGEGGIRYRRADSRDCYALRVAVANDYPIAIVGEGAGGDMGILLERIGINDVFFNVDDKSAALRDWMAGRGLEVEQVLCMGSEVSDLHSMEVAGFATCPVDAVEDVKEVSTYISHYPGGAGAVRDVIEKVMKLQGVWGEKRIKR